MPLFAIDGNFSIFVKNARDNCLHRRVNIHHDSVARLFQRFELIFEYRFAGKVAGSFAHPRLNQLIRALQKHKSRREFPGEPAAVFFL